jgi:hypothetical protein
LPRYRLLVEKLAQKGLLKVISGTDTLGVGVNVPIRSVLFTKLCKYDGSKTRVLSVRDFQQISGRAGRKGFDVSGSVVAQAPEHVIENMRLESKANGDAKKLRKMVRKKPPEKGYAHWDRATFDKLVTSPPEPLESRFTISHAMLLSVLGRDEGGCRAMKRLIKDCHDRPAEQRIHGRKAKMMLRALWEAGIVELVPRDVDPRGLRVTEALGAEFSMHQALSLFLVETISVLDREAETYAMDVLTLVESILENPEIVLMKQLDALKTLKMAEMKAAGIEFDKRIEELEKLEYPKPLRDFVYEQWNAFSKKHPWAQDDNIRPKSIARELCETRMSFAEYIKEYGLERAEGVLLRYLTDAYKTLAQTVPESDRTDEIIDAMLWLGTLVRGVDGSLLEEWERLRHPGAEAIRPEGPGAALLPDDVTRDVRAFTVLVRNEVFSLVRALARRDYVDAADLVETSEDPWPPERLESALRPFFAEHATIRVDAGARAPAATKIKPSTDGATWRVEQTLFDPEGDDDWFLDVAIDLAASREASRPVLTLIRLER